MASSVDRTAICLSLLSSIAELHQCPQKNITIGSPMCPSNRSCLSELNSISSPPENVSFMSFDRLICGMNYSEYASSSEQTLTPRQSQSPLNYATRRHSSSDRCEPSLSNRALKKLAQRRNGGDVRLLESSYNTSERQNNRLSFEKRCYKTELCKRYLMSSTHSCEYGSKCQFAHGVAELRLPPRHPRYKTEICHAFHTLGDCPYGRRCAFIHNETSDRLATIRCQNNLYHEYRRNHPDATDVKIFDLITINQTNEYFAKQKSEHETDADESGDTILKALPLAQTVSLQSIITRLRSMSLPSDLTI